MKRRSSRILTATVTTTWTRILGPSQNRVGLEFYGPVAGSYHFDIQPGASFAEGVFMFLGIFSRRLTLQDHGEMVRHDWFARADAGSRLITYMETLEWD